MRITLNNNKYRTIDILLLLFVTIIHNKCQVFMKRPFLLIDSEKMWYLVWLFNDYRIFKHYVNSICIYSVYRVYKDRI